MKQSRSQTTSFGEALRRARLARGWSLRRTAHRVGVDHTYIDKLERGTRRHPSDMMLRALCAELRIRVSDLIP